MRLWVCSLREVQRRSGRALLTLLGITLGLATVVATQLTTRTVSVAYRSLFAGAGDEVSLEVTAPGLASFNPSLGAALGAVPGVRAVCPRLHGAVTLIGRDGGVSAPLLGVAPGGGESWPTCEGRDLDGPEQALLDGGLARELGVAPGHALHLWTPEGPAELRLAGILKPRRAGGGSGGLLLVPLATAQRLLNVPDHVNSLRLVLAKGSSPDAVRQAVAQRLPEELRVHPPGREGEVARSTLQAAEQGLAGLGVMAVVTAAFVTLNTILLNLSERRQQLALLKTLGATRWQVLYLVLGEMLLLGLAGTLLGCTLGCGLAVGLRHVMEQFLGMALPPVQLSGGPFLLAGILGPTVSLLAVLLPAWHASGQTPLAELRPRGVDREESVSLRLGWLGLLLLAVGLLSACALCRGWLPARWGQRLLFPTIASLLGGGVLAFPLLLRPLLALLRPLAPGLEGTLAGQQLARHQTRTGLTAGVLFLALSVAISFGHSLQGILRDLHDWYRQTVVADFLVRGSLPDTAFVLAAALPEALGDELAVLDGVACVDRISFLPGQAGGQDLLVLARTFRAPTLPLDLREGNRDEVRARLLAGEVVLGTGLAEARGLHRGDTLTLTTARGDVPLRVAGTASEFAGGGSSLYLEWERARQLLDLPGAHVFLVTAKGGQVDAAGRALRQFCRLHQLQVQSNADLREQIDQSLAQVTGGIWALLALIFVVAGVGIVNTLLMNVQDQLRGFCVLRMLGFRAGQVGRLVVIQALLLAGVSIPPGVLAGLGLAYLISRGSVLWAGVVISFRVDVSEVAGCCGLAVACALLASLVQARRAARMGILAGLQGR